MTSKIAKVALAGAAGNLGSYILPELLSLGFKVTALSRSQRQFPAGVDVKVVDYSSSESLKAALEGQDAVIDATALRDAEVGIRLINAAAESGVYRFIGNEYGLDPELPGVLDLPVFHKKRLCYEALKAHRLTFGFTYTLVACGGFLDLCLSSGFAGINLERKSAALWDKGNNVVPWTTRQAIAKATANVLTRPQETRNSAVYIYSTYLSQSQLLDAAKDALGSEGWTITSQDMKQLYEKSLADIEAGTATGKTYSDQVHYALSREELASPWKVDDNAILGVEVLPGEQVRGLIKELASSG